ncbi:hypothetical protein SDRG_16908 [Saprolegnia diclina VS20]|uniref:DNA 5'-3' helicase FANCJ n=1 Tax=Saprolegnia diclina (strain VS20) TaxID=1156394 RepID=T0PW04_SAPDV|nr:hypothetical protein SDRG_16908 [Saprolegnia diclina VS20]EQC25210.1 hypothetical protein SDRG_16908 [Saprolegnia diclina VS20]|eukprot:XP_008621354.1 hypothetical protein SDRG_16908 [Saprolegnia diclina VS20]
MEVKYEEPAKKPGFMIMGYGVDFPEGKTPFPSQLAVMSKVLLALKKQQNALLESPTGSGKTLALLCSSLAWQRQHMLDLREAENKRINEEVQRKLEAPAPVASPADLDSSVASIDDDFAPVSFSQFQFDKKRQLPDSLVAYATTPSATASTPASMTADIPAVAKEKIPTIYFCSRTHSQISQVVQELRRCPHADKVKMVVLGSKKHYCVNPAVRNLDPGKINDECSKKREENSCKFVKKLKTQNEMRKVVPPVWDIEELVEVGEELRECPYYYTHAAVEQATLVFCPYNYIMDPTIRAAVKIDLKSAIVILDEAHNIEDVCRSSASMELTYDQLEDASKSFEITIKAQVMKSPSYLTLLRILNGWKRWLGYVDRERMLRPNGYETESQKWSGADAMAILGDYCGVTAANIKDTIEIYHTVATEERTNDDDPGNTAEAASQTKQKGVKLTSVALLSVLSVLTVANFLFRDDHVDDYKLVAIKSRPFGGGKKAAQMQLKVCLWCLHAGVAFSEITSQVRSVVLTSGTLSPMTSFAGELGTKFPITLEANHVVDMRKQVFLGAIMTGHNRVDLSASYSNQQDLAYQDAIGQLVLRYSAIIPGGILVFLPSYRLMTQLHARWEQTGLLDDIAQHKQVFTEPRSAGKDFDDLLEEYKNVITKYRAPSKTDAALATVDLSSDGNDEKPSTETKTGAVFMAVYRGKVSEGIDFSNDNARAVLAIGIPFPNIKEQQVALKQEYQNMKSVSNKELSNGRVWYEHQAFRALNQALGRCIRHRLDYGAILLVDSRHRSGRYANQLSKWTRGHLLEYEHAEFAVQDVKDFFARVTTDPSLEVPIEAPKPAKAKKKTNARATKGRKAASSSSSGWYSKKPKTEPSSSSGYASSFVAPGSIGSWMANHATND